MWLFYLCVVDGMRFNGWMDGRTERATRRASMASAMTLEREGGEIPYPYRHHARMSMSAHSWAPSSSGRPASVGVLPRAQNRERDLIFAFSMAGSVRGKDPCGSATRSKQASGADGVCEQAGCRGMLRICGISESMHGCIDRCHARLTESDERGRGVCIPSSPLQAATSR